MQGRLADAGISDVPAVPARRAPDRAPLSFSQRLVWSHQRRVPESTANNICLAFTYTGPVDREALRRALFAVVRRHEILRTTYHADADGEPFQRIHEEFPLPVASVDLRPASAPECRLHELISKAATEPFDLAAESSVRVSLVDLPSNAAGAPRLAMVVAMQHILWDGMTLPVMARDVARFYDAALTGPDIAVDPPPRQVADFAEWEQDRFAAADHTADTRFWEDQFAGVVDTANLPYDHRLDAAPETSTRHDRVMSAAADSALRSLSSELRTPPFTVFLTAYYLALRRLTGRSDVLIGTAVANREETGTQDLIGNFSNSIPLRIRGAGPRFADLVEHTRTVTDAAFAHRAFPFTHITDIARKATADDAAQPFDSLVLFLDQKVDGIHLPGTTMTWKLADKGRLALPLTVEAFMHPDRTDVQISYRVALFADSAIERLHDHLDDILAAATARLPLADLLTAEDSGE